MRLDSFQTSSSRTVTPASPLLGFSSNALLNTHGATASSRVHEGFVAESRFNGLNPPLQTTLRFGEGEQNQPSKPVLPVPEVLETALQALEKTGLMQKYRPRDKRYVYHRYPKGFQDFVVAFTETLKPEGITSPENREAVQLLDRYGAVMWHHYRYQVLHTNILRDSFLRGLNRDIHTAQHQEDALKAYQHVLKQTRQSLVQNGSVKKFQEISRVEDPETAEQLLTVLAIQIATSYGQVEKRYVIRDNRMSESFAREKTLRKYREMLEFLPNAGFVKKLSLWAMRLMLSIADQFPRRAAGLKTLPLQVTTWMKNRSAAGAKLSDDMTHQYLLFKHLSRNYLNLDGMAFGSVVPFNAPYEFLFRFALVNPEEKTSIPKIWTTLDKSGSETF